MPHVTLKSIANNPDIQRGDDAARRSTPRSPATPRPRRSTTSRTRTRKRVRVTGPFTVESLSPHRVLLDRRRATATAESAGQRDRRQGQFVTMILDNLRKAGVQNTDQERAARLRPPRPVPRRVDPGDGEYTDADGKSQARRGRRSAPSTAPSARSRSRRPPRRRSRASASTCSRLRLRLRPARRRRRRKRYGRLTVLPARMNPDLAMGDELLKKTGAGNLFMVFGEPDIDVRDGRRTASSTVEIRGARRLRPDDRRGPLQLDRRHRLLVHRHRLRRRELLRPPRLLHRRRRAVRQAEARPARRDRRGRLVDALHAPTSRPFDPPETGKIAVPYWCGRNQHR